MNDSRYSLVDFDYELPEHLIAQAPPARRDASRLLRMDRSSGQLASHAFGELPDLLRDGDLLVLNDTKVIPAKFAATRETGASIEGLFIRADGDGASWQVLLKNARRCKLGETITLQPPDASEPIAQSQGLTLLESLGAGRWRVAPSPAGEAEAILAQFGATPLPPYIRRAQGDSPEDPQRYQTVYAASPGAVAAPTAGLHFTPELFATLAAKKGIEAVHVTLHVGLGTFSPVKQEDLTRHEMHVERYALSPQAAAAILAAKQQSRRIVAVGTTSVRVLESVAAAHAGQLTAGSGETNLFLYPPAKFHIVDALITNFHLPKSTLLMLTAAFADPGGVAGLSKIQKAYQYAIEHEYRFFSYGDAMLIE